MEEKLKRLEQVCRDYPDKKFNKLIYTLFAAEGILPHMCAITEPISNVFVVSWVDKESLALETYSVDMRGTIE